ncbi:hypothetical protein HDU93_005481, partial [Gonapodya sp. JEL0774]
METLEYHAKFLMKESTVGGRRERVKEVLDQMGLSRVSSHRIGNPESQLSGISSGETKRLSVAVQLLERPSVLFLDEPTTGLDSATALNTMEYVGSLRKNCMILLSIHQPREHLLALFDKVILLSAGQVLYFGTVQSANTFFGSLGLPIPLNTNPADHWIDLITPYVDTIDFGSESVVRSRLTSIIAEKDVGLVDVDDGSLSEFVNMQELGLVDFALSRMEEYLVLTHLVSKIFIRDLAELTTR